MLLNHNQLHNYFSEWKPHFRKYENYLLENKINKISLCVNFAFSNDLISDIIIGIKNQKQLKEILEINLSEIKNTKILKNNDIRLIQPFRWKIK